MKNKVLTLIIGILIGAILTTAGFLIYNKTISKNSTQPEMMQINGNEQNGEQNGSMSEPPSKPDSDNGEEPPTKPDESINNINN